MFRRERRAFLYMLPVVIVSNAQFQLVGGCTDTQTLLPGFYSSYVTGDATTDDHEVLLFSFRCVTSSRLYRP